ncbi:MAG: ATP-binding protein, partial [Chloroflexota bacterium]
LLDAFLSQYALALEAVQLADKAQQADLLSAKEKLQTTILNSVSHDLRTPLVSIKGALSSLLEDGNPLTAKMQQDLLIGAFEETERLNNLVGNLLDMSRLQAGSIKLKREPYAIDEIISVARSQRQTQLKQHHVEVDIQPSMPLIKVDLVLFAQVIVNLLDNAAKYSSHGTKIEIRAYQSNEQVYIEVADAGVGIPADELQSIFKKFYRASTASPKSGTGLGLSIVYGIVELHNGHIEASQRPNGGTIFTITLPVTETLSI